MAVSCDGRDDGSDMNLHFLFGALFGAASCVPAAQAQLPIAPEPMTREQIDARAGKPIARDEVLTLVSGARVHWIAFAGGERIWNNEPDGSLIGTRIGTGVGSFNPHHKSGRGHWLVRDDGAYCMKIDYGSLLIESWCWTFYKTDTEILMQVTPEERGARIAFEH
jgi:hypothetical protein